MTMTDPIADMLTRIRNANRIERAAVDMPASKLKLGVAETLRREGFIHHFQVGRAGLDEQGKLHAGSNLVLVSFGAGYTWGGIYVKWQ